MKHRRNKGLAALLIGLCWSQAAAAAPQELTLQDSIRMALANNPAVKIAQADKDKAQWSLREAKAARWTTITFSHADARSKSAGDNPADNFSNSVGLSWPLYTGGQREGLIGQAKANFVSADFGVEKSRQQLRLDATSGYYAVLQTRNLLQVARESVDNLNAHLRNVQLQFDAGTVAKSDVLRSEVEVANAVQNQIKAQNNYDLAVASLNNVIGAALETQWEIREDLSYTKVEADLVQGIRSALQQRPEIAQSKAGMDAAREGISVAKSGYRPSMTLSSSSGWSDSSFPGDENNTWRVTLTTSWTVFDTGVTRAKVQGAKASYEKTVQQDRQLADSVALEVQQAVLNVREAEKRITTSQKAVEKAEDDFKIARLRYDAGVGTNLDVLDSQVALTQAKTNYYQALYDYNVNRAKLEKAMGVPVSKG